MKRMFICGNWKMNTDRRKAVELAGALKASASTSEAVEVGACPPFVYLEAVSEVLSGSGASLGGQNMYFEAEGAFTAEISAAMLLDVGCSYVILGHSERRHVMGEGDEIINRKVHAAFAAGLKPILCVGELLDEREAGETRSVVERHVREGLNGVSSDDAANAVLAYEPVWAIGTGKTATPDQANEVHEFIRGLLTDMYDAETAASIRIQYGGSVKSENAYELMSQPEVDGALVGGASLKGDSFDGIISEAARACG